MDAYWRSSIVTDRWWVSIEADDLSEVARRILASRCRKVVVIETVQDDEIAEAVA